MLILFDHVTPRGIARLLLGHTVTLAKERGWDTLTNGDLLAEAERAGFEVLVTAECIPNRSAGSDSSGMSPSTEFCRGFRLRISGDGA